jgi:hypothetical protein
MKNKILSREDVWKFQYDLLPYYIYSTDLYEQMINNNYELFNKLILENTNQEYAESTTVMHHNGGILIIFPNSLSERLQKYVYLKYTNYPIDYYIFTNTTKRTQIATNTNGQLRQFHYRNGSISHRQVGFRQYDNYEDFLIDCVCE